jgi:hypothetical protein
MKAGNPTHRMASLVRRVEQQRSAIPGVEGHAWAPRGRDRLTETGPASAFKTRWVAPAILTHGQR